MTLGFQYPVAVYRLASKDAYEACDFTAAQLLLAGGEYVLSESFLSEGSNYFASEEECEAGLKFEASSAEYTNYAGFSWPVNAPGRRTAHHPTNDNMCPPAVERLFSTLWFS